MSARERCVLAYSGGLDTSVAIRWLQEELGYDVITLTADLGESKDVDAVAARALRTGALSAHIADARRVFVDAFCFPTLAAGALYEGVYPLATALARPLIAKLLVDVAREEGATAVAHGCTGKGNDQVRFDVAVGALAPELRVVAPVRDWDMGRPQELDYATAHGIEVTVTKESPYSVDANLWGRSIESGVLEDPWIEPPDEVYEWTARREAHTPATVVEIAFERGVPVSLDVQRSGVLERTLHARLGAQRQAEELDETARRGVVEAVGGHGRRSPDRCDTASARRGGRPRERRHPRDARAPRRSRAPGSPGRRRRARCATPRTRGRRRPGAPTRPRRHAGSARRRGSP